MSNREIIVNGTSPRPDKVVWRSNRTLLAAIFILALAARAGAVIAISNFDTVTGFENEKIALHLLGGAGYSLSHFGPVEPTVFMYPLYPFFLAGLFFVFGHAWLPVELVQSLIGALGVFLIFRLGAGLFDRPTGLLAAVAYALYPVYVYWCGQGQPLTIEVVLLLALVVSWRRGTRGDDLRQALLSGFLLGLCALSRTMYLAFFPSLVLWSGLGERLSWRRTLRFSGLVLAVALVTISPWTVRNALVFNRFILASSNTGYNLWVGNNPNASGGLFLPGDQHILTSISPELKKEIETAKDSPGRDLVFMRAATDYIRSDPVRFFRMIPARLYRLWYFDPNMPSTFPLLSRVVYMSLLAFAIIGMILSWRKFREHLVLYLFFATITAVYSAFYGQPRFRFAIEWCLIMFAAHAISRILQRVGFFRISDKPFEKIMNERGGT